MADYNSIADDYDPWFKAMPYREHIEAFSVLKLLGDVTDMAVLDVACGTGIYARAVRRRAAARVMGVDISPDMIRVAQDIEAQHPLGITYEVQDVAALPPLGSFDCALGVYLLHYAPSYDQLAGMCRSIAGQLVPGSRFVTYQLNPDMARDPDYYAEYGLRPQGIENLSDASAFTFTATIGEMTTPPITAYYWSKETVESALVAGGFADIRWHRPEVSAEGLAQYGADIWRAYLAQPHCMLIECVKR
jgi:toxoflavin synthase